MTGLDFDPRLDIKVDILFKPSMIETGSISRPVLTSFGSVEIPSAGTGHNQNYPPVSVWFKLRCKEPIQMSGNGTVQY